MIKKMDSLACNKRRA